MDESLPAQTEEPSDPLFKLAAWALILGLAAVTWAMTSLTHNLDDIKRPIFIIAGPLLMLAGLGLILAGRVPAPPRWVVIGGLGYLLVMAISTLASAYSWAGWPQILLLWSAGGFFIAAMVVASRPPSARILPRGLTVVLLITNFIGFFMYDFSGSPAHPGGIAWLFKLLYHGNENNTGALYNLLSTLAMREARGVMQSTILSRDFYGGFCLLLLPFAMLSAFMPTASPSLLDRLENLFWRLLGILATLTAILSIFYCHNYLLNVIDCLVIGLMLLGAFFALRRSGLYERLWPAFLGLSILILGTCSPARFIPPAAKAHMTQFPGMMRVLWGAAWGVFKDHPLLGGGPGTYGILQYAHRSPDYYLHQVSNVSTFSYNYFLDLLSETGLAGFACFLILLLALLLPALRRSFRHVDPAYRLACLAASVSLIASVLFGLFNPVTRWIVGTVPLWSIMGLTAGLLMQEEVPAPQPLSLSALDDLRIEKPRSPRSGMFRWLSWLLFCLGWIILPLSIGSGVSVFKAALKYAVGINYMEYGYKQHEQASAPNHDQRQVTQHLQDAASEFEECLRLDPTDLSAYYKLGSVKTTLSQLEAARSADEQKKGLTLEAGQSQARADHDLEQAVKTYEQLTALAPDYAEIHYNLGIVYSQYAAMFERQFKQEPARTDLKEQAAKYKDLALSHLARMLKFSNKKEIAALYSSQCEAMGRNDLVVEALKQAIEHYPDDADLVEQCLNAATAANDPKTIGAMRERLARLKAKAPAQVH